MVVGPNGAPAGRVPRGVVISIGVTPMRVRPTAGVRLRALTYSAAVRPWSEPEPKLGTIPLPSFS